MTTSAWLMTLISPSFRYSILSSVCYIFKRQYVSIKSWHLCSKQVFIHSVKKNCLAKLAKSAIVVVMLCDVIQKEVKYA